MALSLKILGNLILSIYYRYSIQGTSAWSRYMLNFVFSKKLATGKLSRNRRSPFEYIYEYICSKRSPLQLNDAWLTC